jgi:hypothetical protein
MEKRMKQAYDHDDVFGFDSGSFAVGRVIASKSDE